MPRFALSAVSPSGYLLFFFLLIPEKIGHQVKGGAGDGLDMGYTKNEFPAADRFNVSNFLKYLQKEGSCSQAEQS